MTDRKDMDHNLNANLYAIVKLPFGFEYQMNFNAIIINGTNTTNHESSRNIPNGPAMEVSSERKNQKTFNWQVDNIRPLEERIRRRSSR